MHAAHKGARVNWPVLIISHARVLYARSMLRRSFGSVLTGACSLQYIEPRIVGALQWYAAHCVGGIVGMVCIICKICIITIISTNRLLSPVFYCNIQNMHWGVRCKTRGKHENTIKNFLYLFRRFGIGAYVRRFHCRIGMFVFCANTSLISDNSRRCIFWHCVRINGAVSLF